MPGSARGKKTINIFWQIDGIIIFAQDDNKLLPFPMYIFFAADSIHNKSNVVSYTTLNVLYSNKSKGSIYELRLYDRAKQELQMQSPGILQLVKLICVVRPCLWQKVAMHRAQ